MFTLNRKGKLLILEKPFIMGILNITPDSFYAGSRFSDKDVLAQAEMMLKEGADILDLGAQSTRPGSKPVSADEELRRLAGITAMICARFPEAAVSIDTSYAKVAAETVAEGACMVNDITAGAGDPDMLKLVGKLRTPFICMHMKGTPQTMQQHPIYENVLLELLDFFIGKINLCRLAGIQDVIIDPGFGFGKTAMHNFEILKRLSLLNQLQRPIVCGLSRKGMIYKTLDIRAEEALNGTAVLNTLALANGAHILRVHDVKEAREVATLFTACAK